MTISSTKQKGFTYVIANHKLGQTNVREITSFGSEFRILSDKVNLMDCIAKHVDWMPLNERTCNHCNQTSTQTQMRNGLWRLPDTLIILLKKFIMDDYGSMSKNDIDVKFPVYDLDLTEF